MIICPMRVLTQHVIGTMKQGLDSFWSTVPAFWEPKWLSQSNDCAIGWTAGVRFLVGTWFVS